MVFCNDYSVKKIGSTVEPGSGVYVPIISFRLNVIDPFSWIVPKEIGGKAGTGVTGNSVEAGSCVGPCVCVGVCVWAGNVYDPVDIEVVEVVEVVFVPDTLAGMTGWLNGLVRPGIWIVFVKKRGNTTAAAITIDIINKTKT